MSFKDEEEVVAPEILGEEEEIDVLITEDELEDPVLEDEISEDDLITDDEEDSGVDFVGLDGSSDY